MKKSFPRYCPKGLGNLLIIFNKMAQAATRGGLSYRRASIDYFNCARERGVAEYTDEKKDVPKKHLSMFLCDSLVESSLNF